MAEPYIRIYYVRTGLRSGIVITRGFPKQKDAKAAILSSFQMVTQAHYVPSRAFHSQDIFLLAECIADLSYTTSQR